MTLGEFLDGKTVRQTQWEQKQAKKALLEAELEQHEGLLTVLRSHGTPIPPKEKLLELYSTEQKRGGSR